MSFTVVGNKSMSENRFSMDKGYAIYLWHLKKKFIELKGTSRGFKRMYCMRV